MTILSPGFKSLGQFNVTSAGSQISEVVENLDGMLAALIQARFAYGSGGTTCKAYVQTSMDQGTTWCDIACVAFTTASEVAVVNLSALTPKTTQVTPTDGVLADDSVVDGVLGDRFRVKVISTGTYAGSTVLSIGAIVR